MYEVTSIMDGSDDYWLLSCEYISQDNLWLDHSIKCFNKQPVLFIALIEKFLKQ